MSWVEEVLHEWGAWVRSKGDGQGWGGAVDLDRLFQACNVRDPGVHSDPVLAEVSATARDDQGPHQCVQRFVLQCHADLREVARLRYVGVWEPTDEPERRDRMRYVASQGQIAGVMIEMGGPMWFRESGGLPVKRIAGLVGVTADTVYARLDRLHQQIRAELIQEARIRKTPSAARREAA